MRGIGPLKATGLPAELPILTSSKAADQPIGYQALYESVRCWMGKAVQSCAVDEGEFLRYRLATAHWLRHTFGTKAVGHGVPLDVVQAQMGHASINTTMGYSRAPVVRRLDELGKVFGNE